MLKSNNVMHRIQNIYASEDKVPLTDQQKEYL